MADEAFVPRLCRVTRDFDPSEELTLQSVESPFSNRTLGAAGPAIEVVGREEFPLTPLIIPFTGKDVTGIDVPSIRVFRLEEETGQFRPIWNSGVNRTLGFFWANIGRRGTYLPIGLSRDVLARECLHRFDLARQQVDGGSEGERRILLRHAFAVFLEASDDAIQELRGFLTRLEIQTGPGLPSLAPYELRIGQGGHLLPFPLPEDITLGEFRKRLDRLEIPRDGLPEEELFRDPMFYRDDLPPWMPSTAYRNWNGVEDFTVDQIRRELENRRIDLAVVVPWLFSKNWWMHQHNRHHTGEASGGSNIRSGSVQRLIQQSAVAVDGPVVTKPAIVDGRIYIGTSKFGANGGGTLYRIDLASGAVEQTFPTSGTAFYGWAGIGGSPAVVGNRIYISTVYGKIYCIDRVTFTQIWKTDLKDPNEDQNQPVRNPNGDSWSGPLVVNDRVYVSGGEGESTKRTYGYLFCLDAATGRVIWLYCTNNFVDPMAPGHENQPNMIPESAAADWAKNAGFRLYEDPPYTGVSPWSSCAYDRNLDRVYVCTGNSHREKPLPDARYASGMLSLDATTGEFRGFFQPLPSDSYWPGDLDIDAPCSPTLYTTGGRRVVAFGGKNGSFFILDADTLEVVARRQLLPKKGGTGLPGDVGDPIHAVVPLPGTPPTGENKWGVFATAAVHSGLERLFVGLGGYMGVNDPALVPFMRAVDWNDLTDAWHTTLGIDDVFRYTTTTPPMYQTIEAGLSAPSVVNDVVFISTSMSQPLTTSPNKTALYAFDANTGVCLWSASAASLGGFFSLGPAIYGDYIVLGAGNTLYIFRLQSPWFDVLSEVDVRRSEPYPEADPRVLELLRQIRNQTMK